MTPALREACRLAIHVVTPGGEALRAGRACLGVLRVLGWRRTAAVLSVRPLVWAVELGYWIVARNRGRIGRLLHRRRREDAP